MKHMDHSLIRRSAVLAALALLCLALAGCDYLQEQVAADLAFAQGTIDPRLVGVWRSDVALLRFGSDGWVEEGATDAAGGFVGLGSPYEWRVKDGWLANRDRWGTSRAPIAFNADGTVDINRIRYARR